jgi:NhaA family Na+:H+ antiporter
LPLIAALVGFVVPVGIYDAIDWAVAQASRSWAVPAATDIAFTFGICALLGRAVPRKTFLLALAIIDDLAAIIVIALYTDELSTQSLVLAGIGLAALAVLNRLDVRKPSLFVVVGVLTWVCVLKSGVG